MGAAGGGRTMTPATLKITELRAGMKRFVLDCDHGTTTGHAMNEDGMADAVMVATLLIKHFASEGCGCTEELRRKYPPSLLPRTLCTRRSIAGRTKRRRGMRRLISRGSVGSGMKWPFLPRVPTATATR